MLAALREGLAAVRRNWGLPLLLLGTNLGVAGLLALPLAGALEERLEAKESASHMLYGFDHAWWSRWSDEQVGWTKAFGPEIFGHGFAFRNLELLLKGQLPLGLLAGRGVDENGENDAAPEGPGAVILGLGGLYLLMQTFLAGGVIGVMRAPQGGWTVRGLLHGSGFYFGRFARIAVITLAAAWALFGAYRPLARWADHQAMEAVSERTALAWSFSHHLLLLLALLALNMVSSYAKVALVVEERSSALLAWLSALAFCASRWRKAFGHYLAVAALGVLLLAAWALLAGAWPTTGYKSQLVALLLMQALVYGRLFLRVALLGGMVALYRAEAR
jgi:hypothetical protein